MADRVLGPFFLLASALCFSAITAFAQAPPRPACPDACPYVISGTVVNSVTGAPVSRALVSLSGSLRAVMLTSGDGHFEFSELPSGAFQIYVRKPGFSFGQTTARDMGGGYMVRLVDRNIPSVRLVLTPHSALLGRVTDEHGLPVLGLQVVALKRNDEGGKPGWKSVSFAETDGLGRYRLSHLPPGQYCLGTRPNRAHEDDAGNTTEESGAVFGFPATFLPCSAGSEDGFELRPGQQLQSNLHVHSTRFVTVSGMIPIQQRGQAYMTLKPNLPVSDSFRVDVRADGAFQSEPVPPGNYLLVGSVGEPASGVFHAYMPVTVRGEITDLHVTLAPAIRIRLFVSGDQSENSEEPVVGAGSVRPRQRPGAFVYLMSLDDEDGRATCGANVGAEAWCQNLRPGRYIASFATNGAQYIASATYGGTDLLDGQPVEITSGSSETILVVVRSDGATLKGEVEGYGSLSTLVAAIPDSNTGGSPGFAPLGPDGKFAFASLKPGSYTVGIASNIGPSALRTKAEDLSFEKHVTVQPYQQAYVALEVAEAGK